MEKWFELYRGIVMPAQCDLYGHSYEMRMYETDSMTHSATQKTVEVCFDTEKRVSAPLPDDIREKLVALVSK